MASGSGIGAEARKARQGASEGFIKTSAPGGSAPALKEAVAAVQAPLGPENDSKGKGVLKDHEFDLEYVDGRGYLWSGQFKCHALTYKERIDVGLIRSRMSGGVPPHLLDATTSNLLEMLAHLAVAVDAGPPWARDMEAIHDPAVVVAIYKEVLAHEERFHGAGPGGAGAGDDALPSPGHGEGSADQDG
jgi:hypothetical protein